MSSRFDPGTGGMLNYDSDDGMTDDDDEAFEAAGKYNGTDGTYRCAGPADCMVTFDPEGMIMAMSSGWVFTPETGATSDQPGLRLPQLRLLARPDQERGRDGQVV